MVRRPPRAPGVIHRRVIGAVCGRLLERARRQPCAKSHFCVLLAGERGVMAKNAVFEGRGLQGAKSLAAGKGAWRGSRRGPSRGPQEMAARP